MQDAESLVDALFEANVVHEDRDGVVRTTSDFEDTRAIYYDTYGHTSDEEFRQAVADTFDLEPAEALQQIGERNVTRQSFVAYLSLKSFLAEGAFDRQELAAMGDIVAELSAGSPVPDGLIEVTDESAVSFLAEHPESAVIVFKHHCDPCDALKESFDDLEAATPDHVTWAGVDGEEAVEFCQDHGVEAAPTTLLFEDGELVESKRGWAGPERLIEALERVYRD